MRKHETAVCGTARTVVWEVGKCENRRWMPFMISIYLLPDSDVQYCWCSFLVAQTRGEKRMLCRISGVEFFLLSSTQRILTRFFLLYFSLCLSLHQLGLNCFIINQGRSLVLRHSPQEYVYRSDGSHKPKRLWTKHYDLYGCLCWSSSAVWPLRVQSPFIPT